MSLSIRYPYVLCMYSSFCRTLGHCALTVNVGITVNRYLLAVTSYLLFCFCLCFWYCYLSLTCFRILSFRSDCLANECKFKTVISGHSIDIQFSTQNFPLSPLTLSPPQRYCTNWFIFLPAEHAYSWKGNSK